MRDVVRPTQIIWFNPGGLMSPRQYSKGKMIVFQTLDMLVCDETWLCEEATV